MVDPRPSASPPRVSIGMPVYNDGPFVARAIAAVLAQDYADFELFISDNASTDGTSEICRTLQQSDNRIRYVRHERNRGAVWNFRHVYESCHGEYFIWAGGHDVLRPAFVSSCVRVLDEQRDVVLAYPEIKHIDRDDVPIAGAVSDKIDTRGESLTQRTRKIIRELYSCHMIYGLFRKTALDRCRHGIICRGPDHVLLMELSLHGTIAHVPQVLLDVRENRGQTDKRLSYENYMRGQLMRLDPHAFSRGKVRPHWRWLLEHVKGVLHAHIAVADRVALLPVVVQTFWQRWNIYLKREIFAPLTAP